MDPIETFDGDRWRALVDSARDAYVAVDADGVVTEWNRRASALFGWEREEAVGQVLADLIVPPEYREAHLLGLRRFVETGRGNVAFQRLQLPALRRDGGRVEVEFTILPTRGPHGRWSFHAFLHDVSTERLQRSYLRLLQRAAVAANEAETVEGAVRSTVEAVQEVTEIRLAHAYLFEGGRLRPTGWWFPGPLEPFTTETAASLFAPGEGLPGRVAASGQATWIRDLADDDRFPRREAALSAGLRSVVAFPVVTGERVVAVIEMFSKRPSDPDAQLLEVMGTLGAQLGRVFERQQALEELRRLADDREAIVSIVGHELRGPLTAAHAATGLMADALADGDQRTLAELLQMSGRQLRRLRRIVDTFVTAQRLDADAIEPHRQPVNLRGVVTQVLDETDADGIKITVGPDIEPKADPDHVWQIVSNLVTNAVRHGASPITVWARQDGARVTFGVSDAGRGVPLDLRPHLFERFSRDASSQGTGLGLAVVRGLARANGGDVDYVTGDDGHSFVVDLPAA